MKQKYKMHNNFILVKFEEKEKQGGIIIPERYKIQEGDFESNGAWGVTTDRRLINPQVINILQGDRQGKRAFVHYGAYEIAKWPEPDIAVIPASAILFFLDPIEPTDKTYLGKEVFTDGEKTESGIYLTPYAEKKEGIKIKLTHACKNGVYKAGQMVITIDNHQYPLNYEGEKFIKLKEHEIVGYEDEAGYHPNDENVLIEYLPDAEVEAISAQNDIIRAQRDFYDKNHIHIPQEDLSVLQEPKTARAKVLKSGKNVIVGSEVIVKRNYGCILPDKTWIVNQDIILACI